MGLNLFAVPLLAFIDPVYVPGPRLLVARVFAFVLGELPTSRKHQVRELGLALIGLIGGTAAAAVLLVWVAPEYLPRRLGVGADFVVAVAVSVAGYQFALMTRTLLAASSRIWGDGHHRRSPRPADSALVSAK